MEVSHWSLPLLKGYPMEESRACQLYPKFSQDHCDLPTHLERKESAVVEVQVLLAFVPSHKHLNPSSIKNKKDAQRSWCGHKNRKAKKSKAQKYKNNKAGQFHLVKVVSGSRFVGWKKLPSMVNTEIK